MKTLFAVTLVTCLTGLLSGCVVAPAQPYAYGPAPAPEYAPAYGPAPGYYVEPSVSVGVGFGGGGGGHWHGH